MTFYRSQLRDLAKKLRAVAQDHIAYSQVAEFMNHVDNHLNALAFIEETNHLEGGVPFIEETNGGDDA